MSVRASKRSRKRGGRTSGTKPRLAGDGAPVKVPAVEKRLRACDPARGPTRADVWGRILARRLRMELGAEVDLTITDNTRTMIAFAREKGRYRVRLHHMFLEADDHMLACLGKYLRGEGASSGMDRFMESHRHLVRSMSPRVRQRRLRLQARGAHHDLASIFEKLCKRYFDGEVDARITWATVPRVRGRRKSIRLGSYSQETGTIRIHPALDHPRVPSFFVQWIVFHELLHVVEGVEPRDGRRVVHTERFKEREREFAHLRRAKRWERKHITWLLGWQPPAEHGGAPRS